MKAYFCRLTVLVLFFSVLIPVTSFAVQNQKLALVIGNGVYQSGPLKNTVNDANDMAAALKGLGFSVALKTNAGRRTMKEAIRGFGRRLRKGGVGLFYYAGHGIQVKGRNYLIPVGVQIETESEMEYEAVDAGRLLGQMEDAGNGLNIIILDACRNNPFGRGFRSSQRGLAIMNAPDGTILAYATSPGEVAADGDGRNGLYTAKLLKHMQTPGLPIELFFKQVRRDVRQASSKRQVPWTESSLIGDFYFIPSKGEGIDVERKRLEQERQELTRLKAEFEARQKLTEETKPLNTEKDKSPSDQNTEVASVDPAVVSAKVIDKDGRYEKYASGVVFDTKTGLEWYAGPDENTDWSEAKWWVTNLSVAGGGWRMPKRRELITLYQKGVGTRNMTPLLKTTGWFVWLAGGRSGHHHLLYFNLRLGNEVEEWSGSIPSIDTRSFAVRSRR